MRPVNLIPAEERRGENAPLRTGPVAYIILAALILALGGVIAMVATDNQIAERKSELAKLESEDAQAAAKAERLVAYTEFQAMSEQRIATVSELADSRFDWERVMRELALVLPGDVWLVNLAASASPDVSVEGGGGDSDLRASVPGPALELSGCATGQESVAGFVTALKDIEGVTRVGVDSSELKEEEEAGSAVDSGAAATSSGGEDCQTEEFIAKFEIVVAFDAAPISSASAEGETVAAPTETAEETSSEASEGAEGE